MWFHDHITWGIVEMQILEPYSRPTKSETLGVEPRIYVSKAIWMISVLTDVWELLNQIVWGHWSWLFQYPKILLFDP